MFTVAIDKGHASHKGTARHQLLSLFIALVFALTFYASNAQASRAISPPLNAFALR